MKPKKDYWLKKSYQKATCTFLKYDTLKQMYMYKNDGFII
jgi:hypothetical protein